MDTITVTIQEDPEARVWYVSESSLPGLNVEAESFEALRAQLPLAIQDLLAASDDGLDHSNIPVELIARAHLYMGSRA
jgi:predicted RNase H-like HicB family nuclease